MWQHPVSRFGSSPESSIAIEDRKHSPLRTAALSARLRNDGRQDSLLNDLHPSPNSRQFSRMELEHVVEESINRCISQLGLLDMQERVLQTVNKLSLERPDFSPIVSAINEIAQHANHGSDSQAAMIEALSQVKVDMPAPDLGAMEQILQEIRNEVQRTGEDIRRDVAACCDSLRQEFVTMRHETAQTHKESRSDSEGIAGEVRNLPKALCTQFEELLEKSLRRGHFREERHEQMSHSHEDLSEVLRILESLDKRLDVTPDFDVQNLCDTVHDRIVGTRLKLDNSDVVAAAKTCELDHDALSSLLIDKMKRITWTVDNAEVLQRFNSIPDEHAIATAVHGQMSKSSLKVDFSELLCAIDSRLDFTELLDAIQKAEVDFTPILNAISNVKIDGLDSNHLASVVHSRLCNHIFKVDQSEVLQALSQCRAETDPRTLAETIDYARIATEVVERLGNHMFKVDQSELLQAAKEIVDTNITPMKTSEDAETNRRQLLGVARSLATRMERVEHATPQEGMRDSIAALSTSIGQDAIAQLRNEVLLLHQTFSTFELDQRPVLDAINQLTWPDPADIADGVLEALRSRSLAVDNREVLEAIRGISTEVDLTPVLAAISNKEVVQAIREIKIKANDEILEAINSIKVETDLRPILEAVDNRDVLQAIKDMKVFLESFEGRDSFQATKVEADFLAPLDAISNREVLQAIKEIQVDVDLKPVLEAIDNREVLQAIRDLKIDVDLRPVLEAVDNKQVVHAIRDLREATAEVLRAVNTLKVDIDLQPVLEAVGTREVLQAIKDLKVEPDLRPVLQAVDNTAVLKAIKDIKVDVDLQPVLEAVSNAAIDLRPLHEAICKRELEVAPLWEAVSKMKLPDADLFANCITEKLRSAKGSFTPDVQALVDAVAEKLQRTCSSSDADVGTSVVLRDVLNALNSTQADLGAAITRVCSVMDPNPILEAIAALNSPDTQALADAVCEKMSGNGFQRVIDEIRSIRIPPADLTPLIKAINDAEVDLSPATDAVNKVAVLVNMTRHELKQLLKGVKVAETEAVTHPALLTEPVRTVPYSVEVVQKSMQAGVGSAPRIHSPLPSNRGATIAVPTMMQPLGSTPRTPTPRMTNRAQMPSQQASQKPIELLATGDMPQQAPARSVSRQRSLEVLPGRSMSMEAPVDLPAPRLLEQHHLQTGVLTIPQPRPCSPWKQSLGTPAPAFGQLVPTVLTEMTTTVTETVVGDSSADIPSQSSTLLTLSPISAPRSSSVQRASSANRMPKRSDGRSIDPYSTSDSLRTFSFQD